MKKVETLEDVSPFKERKNIFKIENINTGEIYTSIGRPCEWSFPGDKSAPLKEAEIEYIFHVKDNDAKIKTIVLKNGEYKITKMLWNRPLLGNLKVISHEIEE